jgi:hypothetical protein
MVTGALRPFGARSAGQDAIADASDAHEAKMARFSETDSERCVRTSLGWSKIVPGCSSAVMSKTLFSKAVVGRMVSSIPKTNSDAARLTTRGQLPMVQAAMASIWWTFSAVDAPLMAIRRGFMASGISRTSSILSKPLSKVAPFT